MAGLGLLTTCLLVAIDPLWWRGSARVLREPFSFKATCSALHERQPPSNRTLVIILAQTRAGHLTWGSVKKHLLEPLNADLALCVSHQKTADVESDDPFRANAQYIWEFPEPSDWADAYNHVKAVEGSSEEWRKALKIKDQLFGGIKDPDDQHEGSAGILLFYRWFLRENLKRLATPYERYIVTRSDYYYERDHPVVDDEMIWVVEGEDYGGITDRHISIPHKYVFDVLDVLHDVIHHPEELYQEMMIGNSISNWNLEKYLMRHYKKVGVADRIQRFPRVMYAVRDTKTPTRWSTGDFVREDGAVVKYRSEYQATMKALDREAKEFGPPPAATREEGQ